MCIEGPVLVDNLANAGEVLGAYKAALATPGEASLPRVLVDDGMGAKVSRSCLPRAGEVFLDLLFQVLFYIVASLLIPVF
jgi:hypothetical protein